MKDNRSERIFILGGLFVQYLVLITAGIHVDGLSQTSEIWTFLPALIQPLVLYKVVEVFWREKELDPALLTDLCKKITLVLGGILISTWLFVVLLEASLRR